MPWSQVRLHDTQPASRNPLAFAESAAGRTPGAYGELRSEQDERNSNK